MPAIICTIIQCKAHGVLFSQPSVRESILVRNKSIKINQECKQQTADHINPQKFYFLSS